MQSRTCLIQCKPMAGKRLEDFIPHFFCGSRGCE